MNSLKRAALALAAVAVAAVPAHAQIISYTASGAFTPGGAATCLTATSCTQNGFTLSWNNLGAQQNVSAGTSGALGSFGTIGAPPNVLGKGDFSGVGFTLTINQLNPASPSGVFSGIMGGTLSLFGSTLEFIPSSPFLNLGGVQYALNNIQSDGGFVITSPSVSNLSPSSPLLATITTPEPSSIVLLTSGLIGLVPMARRRRRAA